MVVVDTDDLALGQIVRGLGQIRMVDQDDLVVGGVGNDLRSGHAELLKHEGALGGELALGGGLGIQALGLVHQISHGDGGGDGIGIRVFVTYHVQSHSHILLVLFPKP